MITRQLVATYPDDQYILRRSATNFRYLRLCDEAIVALRALHALDPPRPSYVQWLCWEYYNLLWDEVAFWADRYLAVMPDDEVDTFYRVAPLIARGELDQADQLLRSRLPEIQIEAWGIVAIADFRAKRYDVLLDRLLEARPEFAQPGRIVPDGVPRTVIAGIAGELFMKAGQVDHGTDLIEQVIAFVERTLGPDHYGYYGIRGIHHAVLGNEEIAMPLLRRYDEMGGFRRDGQRMGNSTPLKPWPPGRRTAHSSKRSSVISQRATQPDPRT